MSYEGRMCSCGRAAAVAYLTAYGSVCRECWCEALRGPAEFARYRANLAAQTEPQADDAAPLFEGGDWQQQEEQQQAEGPSVAAQRADIERRIAECDDLIACESGSCRTHAIESRYYLNERLAALVAAIEARDLTALTAVVAAGNRERAAVAA